ncbi:hypothetical protein COO60DRAFT_1671048 [Scenedesmus sp. NREL 46B-D3]|nr:hypothetical protein COO60DRAFT_1671048 [Scenedesmus sp. NREL 46B-D3]
MGVLYLRTQPRWLRERVMQAKRLQGAPCAAKPGDRVAVSVVVTDVKGFSALTRQYPEAMIKAMGGHNNIMRKACHMHAGYVLDQEGDSWAVAFHDADDAAAFSLQVQQALARKVWILRDPARSLIDKPGPAPDLVQSLDELHGEQLLKPSAGIASHRQPSMASSAGGRAPTNDASSAAEDDGVGVAARADSCSARRASLRPLAAAGAGAADDANALPAGTPQSQLSARSADTLAAMPGASFTSSRGRGTACSSHSGSDFAMMATASEPGKVGDGGGPLSWLFGRPLSRSSDGSAVHGARLSGTSDTTPQLDTAAEGAAATAGTAHQQQQQQPRDIEAARSHSTDARRTVVHSKPSVASFASLSLSLLEGSRADSSARRSTTDTVGSGSRLHSMSAALLQRFANRGSKTGSLLGPVGGNAAGLQQQKRQLKALRITVRIGIASGTLQHGSDLQNCTVTHRAKELVSDVADGGQVLIDEPTFLLVKDSLSLLGTVSEAGYDDHMLQRLNQAKVVGRLQQQVACGGCLARREVSFSSPLPEDEPQDYEHDAIVVHMGQFAAETPLPSGQLPSSTLAEDAAAASAAKARRRMSLSKRQADTKVSTAAAVDAAAAAAAAATPASRAGSQTSTTAPLSKNTESDLELLFAAKKGSSKKKLQVQALQLYSIASPAMRRWPDNTQDLGAALAWAEPKGFFQAPGARRIDLTPSARSGRGLAPLPEVTLVFAAVAEALSFTSKQSRAAVRGVNASIVKVMLQQMAHAPGRDGYLCRCQEGDLKYMVAFEQPHHAVQWCLAVQEALLYEPWEPAVLRHPGFEPVTCPDSGRLLFAGPRLRMGLAEGVPHSVAPDHWGRANYSGPSVVRAARFMDVAAHGGQVVTNLELVRKLAMGWVAQQREEPQQQQQMSSNSSNKPAEVAGQPQQQQQQQQEVPGDQQPMQPLGLRGAISPIAEGQLLQDAAMEGPRSMSQQQLRLDWVRRSSDGALADAGARRSAAAEQALALPPRSLSWSAARPSARLARAAGPGGSADHAAGQVALAARSSHEGAADAADAAHQPGAALAGNAATLSELDSVFAVHLGQFRFKGSGEYEMVALLHGALAGRTFPAEPPRGKGERLGGAGGGAVRDLPAVHLQLPPALLAARHGFVSQQVCDAKW